MTKFEHGRKYRHKTTQKKNLLKALFFVSTDTINRDGHSFFEGTKFLRMNEKLCLKGCRFFTERMISLEQTFKERSRFLLNKRCF